MTAPPGQWPASEPCGEQITAERDPDLSTKNGQKRYLMCKLGVTRAQAHLLMAAYERDLERPVVTADKTYRPSFLDWLMRQAPGGRPIRAVRKHEWKVTSS